MRTLMAFLLMLSLYGFSNGQEKTPTKDEIIVQQLQEIQKILQEMRETSKKDISDLDNRLKKLEARATTTVMQNNQQIEINRTFDPPNISYGSVRIKNIYVTPVTLYVNGTPYAIPVGSTRVIDVPSGTFTYSVAEINGNKSTTRNLRGSEVFDLTVYPMPPETVTYPYYYGGGNCPQQ